MAKNVIIMIGDGMGWEPARAAAIAKQIQEGQSGNQLNDFYIEGKGEGLNFQQLDNYALATTYGTTIANQAGRFSTGNSALLNSDELVTGPTPPPPGAPATGANPIRPGFEFDPAFNPGTRPDGGATVEGAQGNLVGYDPEQGGALPWIAGNDPEYIKASYPDSANTATTLYTGVKSYNNAVGVDIFEQPLETILTSANELGKSTGLVSSVPIDHATPAAAAANVNRRGKYDGEFPGLDNILQQELRVYQPTVLLGGGHPLSTVAEAALPDGVEPDFTYITETTYNELSNNPNSNIYGYSFLERGPDAASTLLETASEIDPEAGERLLGLYGARGQNGNLPVSSANGDYDFAGLDQFSLFTSTSGDAADQIPEPDTDRPLAPGETDEQFIATERDENPTLTDLTTAALDVLEDDPDGFWLMVEGGDIDWSLHDDNLDNLIGTTLEFDRAVGSVVDWIGNNGGWEDNLLIVTADHDHYLTLNENYPELLRQKGAQALTYEEHTPEDAGHYFGSDSEIKYGWGSHTNRPVPVYYQGSGSEVLDGLVGQGYEAYGTEVPGIEGLVDQVHIYQTMYAAVTEGAAPVQQPPVPLALEADSTEELASPFRFASAGIPTVVAGSNEVIFGTERDDLFDASTTTGGNRVYGRDGNDTLIGGINDLLVGDNGDDALFAGNGGNTLTGGEGNDQFWLAYGSLPNSATFITDFQAGEDVIGFAGLSDVSGFEDLTLVQSGSDTRIIASGQPNLAIAVLEGVQAGTLDSSSFAFA
ncbi:alkaline phosphatase [Oculatella sp. LEGE 06141]|uniref:alkaline phosphatase n=1 Tax=Oculatella sp. LEGE 06141 TaxID=1828648 RepID=UPI0018812FAB|nr:alkaline phosphatase [Oculatella sp. LEGE 06141]MBE9181522.1 alkaline phosphatase [Oculatella sp. LEGE 06141]